MLASHPVLTLGLQEPMGGSRRRGRSNFDRAKNMHLDEYLSGQWQPVQGGVGHSLIVKKPRDLQPHHGDLRREHDHDRGAQECRVGGCGGARARIPDVGASEVGRLPCAEREAERCPFPNGQPKLEVKTLRSLRSAMDDSWRQWARVQERRPLSPLTKVMPLDRMDTRRNAVDEYPGWTLVEFTVDSGATETVMGLSQLNQVPIQRSTTSHGARYEVANGAIIENQG